MKKKNPNNKPEKTTTRPRRTVTTATQETDQVF
jgi:hypothetical protein